MNFLFLYVSHQEFNLTEHQMHDWLVFYAIRNWCIIIYPAFFFWVPFSGSTHHRKADIFTLH
jgi:hypothetical protein